MRQKIAKMIKKEIYGVNYSHRDRKYRKTQHGIEADQKRQEYQYTKKRYLSMDKNRRADIWI